MSATATPEELAPYLAPETTALVLIDVQNDFVHNEGKVARMGADVLAAQSAVGQMNRLIEGARAAGASIVYVRIEHSPLTDRPNYRARYQRRQMDPNDLLCATGSWGAAFYDALLSPRPQDAVVTKYGYDAFQDTPLDAILHSRGIENLIVAGLVTNLCVQTTAEHGFGLGYYIVIPSDATAGDDDMLHTAALRNLGLYFGLIAGTDDILQCWRQPAAAPAS